MTNKDTEKEGEEKEEKEEKEETPQQAWNKASNKLALEG